MSHKWSAWLFDRVRSLRTLTIDKGTNETNANFADKYLGMWKIFISHIILWCLMKACYVVGVNGEIVLDTWSDRVTTDRPMRVYGECRYQQHQCVQLSTLATLSIGSRTKLLLRWFTNPVEANQKLFSLLVNSPEEQKSHKSFGRRTLRKRPRVSVAQVRTETALERPYDDHVRPQ